MKEYVRQLSTIIVVISISASLLLGCTPNYSHMNITETQSNGRYITVEGNYGDKKHSYFSNINSISDNNINHYDLKNFGEKLYVKDDCSIYEIKDDELVQVFCYEAYINDFIAVTDDYILFDSYKEKKESDSVSDNEADNEAKIVLGFYVYYFATDEIHELLCTETSRVNSYYEANELVVADTFNERIENLWLVSGLAGEYQVNRFDSINDLPSQYEVYGNLVIEKRKYNGTTENTELTGMNRKNNGGISNRIQQTSQHTGNVANVSLFNSSFRKNDTRYNICHFYASDWGELAYWKNDVIEEYDVIADEGKVIFKDSDNFIVGYDYRTNTVYQLRMSDYMLFSRSLDDPDNITEIQSFDMGSKIVFIWSENYLLWKYRSDDSTIVDVGLRDQAEEEYGGVIEL